MAKTIVTPLDSTLPALAHLSVSERAALVELTITRAYAAGEILFHEGDSSEGLWFIERGRVRLFKTAPDGHELTVCIARTTDHFCLGTCPLFDGDTHPVSAQALEPVTLKLVNKRALLARTQDNPALGLTFGKMLSDRYRHFTRLTAALALHCIRVRVAEALLEHAQTKGISTAYGIEMNFDLTQELLASCIGTDRAVIARTLLAFEREGILQARGKHIVLYQPTTLQNMLQPERVTPVSPKV